MYRNAAPRTSPLIFALLSPFLYVDYSTAARLESTGKPGKIHVSRATANILTRRGKQGWLEERQDKVMAKGKGEMETYWVRIRASSPGSETDDMSNSASCYGDLSAEDEDKLDRLIEWNTQILLTLLKKVLARRRMKGTKSRGKQGKQHAQTGSSHHFTPSDERSDFFSEVKEIIELPKYSADFNEQNADSIVIDPKVPEQLEEYISRIARLYRKVC
mmetsp:Transcript_17457/g.50332  ORF Transcript_17457/g.50332 Transcript_17457/m.50332 type:complete len:217 (-) Transcript_17457:802-1452(-)